MDNGIIIFIIVVTIMFLTMFIGTDSSNDNEIESEELEKEFERAFETCKVIVELKQFAEENNDPIDWDDTSQGKWFICFDKKIDKIDSRYTHTIKRRDIYFSNSEIARQAIEKVGEDRIKKYYLGVDDE